MAVRVVRYGQAMRCPRCQTVFLVSSLLGDAEVFHAACERRLELLLSLDDCDEVVLSLVELSRDNNRLEVRPGLGVT